MLSHSNLLKQKQTELSFDRKYFSQILVDSRTSELSRKSKLYLNYRFQIFIHGSQKIQLFHVFVFVNSCNHPFLLDGAEDYMTPHNSSEELVYKNLREESGKMMLLSKLLPYLQKNGHRVLMFHKCQEFLIALRIG